MTVPSDQAPDPALQHAHLATTAIPRHASVATTAMPAHAQVATTALPVRGTESAAPAPSRSRQSTYDVGEMIDVGRHRLTVERLLFVGGQAELYLVSGGPAPRAVLKLYAHGARPKADVLERYRLLPPHAVIALLDADAAADPRAWELLTFAEGGPLAGGPEATPVPMRDAARLRLVIRQAAEALHVLHTVGGAVHRDVSPDNFLWLDAERTRLVLSDLGSSSIMSDGAARSVTIRGKLPFMAPEELLPMGEGVVVGEGADFYALGIMILTLWAGHHPFVGREADQIALKSRGAVPVPDDLPADFRSLVEALLLPANIRIGYDGIQRWAAGEAIPRAVAPRTITYPRLTVRPAQGAPYDVDTPAALARFLHDEPVAGERFLYAWNMREWASSDAGLVADLTEIVEKEFPKQRAAGRLKAAYLLDATLPFVTPDGITCEGYASLSEWLEGDPARPKALADPTHPLWLYLSTRPEIELREAMAEIGADVQAGNPEAVALIRHYLMQFAAAGSWRDGDGTVILDLATFVDRLRERGDAAYAKLLDRADPLSLWLETQRPGTAERVGRLRALEPSVARTLAPIDWVAIALDVVPSVLVLGLAAREDSWRAELWPPALALSIDDVRRFLQGWWRVAHGERFECAALAWFEEKPSSGARHQVATALLSGEWHATRLPLSRVMTIAFAALPPHTGSAADVDVMTVAAKALAAQSAAIVAAAAEEQRPLVAVEAATAFAVAAAAARPSAPEWWDALMRATEGDIAAVVREGYRAHRSAPNVLSELVARRAELLRALAPFRLALLDRWRAEESATEVLGWELVAAEQKLRDARLKAITDKTIALRGTPHVQTLSDLSSTLPDDERKWIRRANATFAAVAGFGILSVLPPDGTTGKPEVPTLMLAGALSAWIVWKATRRKLFAVVAFLFGGTILSLTLPVWRLTSARLVIGLLVCAVLGIALVLRRRHVDRATASAESQRRQVPAELSASVRAACEGAQLKGRESLEERWLMMHAVLALAADPRKVSLEQVPGATVSDA